MEINDNFLSCINVNICCKFYINSFENIFEKYCIGPTIKKDIFAASYIYEMSILEMKKRVHKTFFGAMLKRK